MEDGSKLCQETHNTDIAALANPFNQGKHECQRENEMSRQEGDKERKKQKQHRDLIPLTASWSTERRTKEKEKGKTKKIKNHLESQSTNQETEEGRKTGTQRQHRTLVVYDFFDIGPDGWHCFHTCSKRKLQEKERGQQDWKTGRKTIDEPDIRLSSCLHYSNRQSRFSEGESRLRKTNSWVLKTNFPDKQRQMKQATLKQEIAREWKKQNKNFTSARGKEEERKETIWRVVFWQMTAKSCATNNLSFVFSRDLHQGLYLFASMSTREERVLKELKEGAPSPETLLPTATRSRSDSLRDEASLTMADLQRRLSLVCLGCRFVMNRLSFVSLFVSVFLIIMFIFFIIPLFFFRSGQRIGVISCHFGKNRQDLICQNFFPPHQLKKSLHYRQKCLLLNLILVLPLPVAVRLSILVE